MGIVCMNLSVVYEGKQALQGFSASFADGESVCIMGASGVGKTTLLQVLLGDVKPHGGTVEGIKKCAFCTAFQEPRLVPHLNALQNVLLVLPRTADENAVRQLLFSLGLQEEDICQRADTLSGGQQKRVALARALAAQGNVLLLDEPFAGLDAFTAEICAKAVLQNRRGRMLLCVTHNAQDATALAARIVRIE